MVLDEGVGMQPHPRDAQLNFLQAHAAKSWWTRPSTGTNAKHIVFATGNLYENRDSG